MCDEVVSLPVEDRTLVVESLLKSLNQPESVVIINGLKLQLKDLKNCKQEKLKLLMEIKFSRRYGKGLRNEYFIYL